jgi:hypothetical protein
LALWLSRARVNATRASIYYPSIGFAARVVARLDTKREPLGGVEVNAAANVKTGDFKGLRKLAETAAMHSSSGWCCTTGEQIVRFADRLSAVPVSSPWG